MFHTSRRFPSSIFKKRTNRNKFGGTGYYPCGLVLDFFLLLISETGWLFIKSSEWYGLFIFLDKSMDSDFERFKVANHLDVNVQFDKGCIE